MSRAAYTRHRTRQIAYGRWQPYVDAEPARRHLRALQAVGIGTPRAAELSGISASVLVAILVGQPCLGRGPRQKIRPATAAKILAIPVTPEVAAPCALIDSTGTIRRLQALVAIGWSQVRLARELGVNRGNFVGLMNRGQVTVATAAAVRSLYSRLWDAPPPAETGFERNGRRIALKHAADRGWVPPAAWDDDEIDDPKACPRGVRRDGVA
ncbi:hypothetical protein N8J89_07835 [Crossiella sp. CA-258035]|uniref:hypothetical protein n=1 Tax=Crossiella sp. CA-258035 TaxID=2981138 RepID=UPI0024BC90F2|nr:hypothetical protein [Crossiella sp. CA-258035]WHT20964.1 hypothetical protein N8J89_07835 [Crossiella sp. CA-258035]